MEPIEIDVSYQPQGSPQLSFGPTRISMNESRKIPYNKKPLEDIFMTQKISIDLLLSGDLPNG